MFILGLDGGGYKSLLNQGLGGIIFFSKDIQSAEQFRILIDDIKSQSLIPPFLSIDQEGGRVERTENIHGGKKYQSAKYAYEKGIDFLAKQTQDIAQELKSYGVNLNFAPCIDVNTNPDNPIIGERAFSSNPDEVIDHNGHRYCIGSIVIAMQNMEDDTIHTLTEYDISDAIIAFTDRLTELSIGEMAYKMAIDIDGRTFS